MLRIFKVILLFLIIFNFRIPGVYNSTVLSILLSLSYYCLVRRSIPLYYFVQKYQGVILFGSMLMIFVSALVAVCHSTYEFTLVKAATLQLFMLVGLVFALPIMLEGSEPGAFEQVSLITCYAFALQGLIQLTGFLIPPWGDFLISIKHESVQKLLLNDPYQIYFRGYALTGQPFFELPAGFGVAFILFFRTLLIENQKAFIGYRAYIVFALLLIGSIFSGRTAFVGLVIAILMSLVLIQNPVVTLPRIIRKTAVYSIIPILVYFFVLPPGRRIAIEKDVLPFAFEFYYKYEATGQFRTASTDIMIERHYFAIPTETLLFGDGWFQDQSGGFYMKTDAGYMRNILFGGVIYLFCLVIYQSLYFIQPLGLNRWGRTKEERAYFLFFLLLFLHIFILNYKGNSLGTQNIMQVLLLFIGSGYMVQYNNQLVKNGTEKV